MERGWELLEQVFVRGWLHDMLVVDNVWNTEVTPRTRNAGKSYGGGTGRVTGSYDKWLHQLDGTKDDHMHRRVFPNPILLNQVESSREVSIHSLT